MLSQPIDKSPRARRELTSLRPAKRADRPLGRRWQWIAGVGLTLLALGGSGYWAVGYPRPSPDALLQRAQADFDAGHYEAARAALTRLGRLREPTPEDLFLRGKLAMAQNRLEEALADLARVSDDHRSAAQARLTTGRIEVKRGRLRFAEAALLAAIRLDPSLAQAHRELIYIYSVPLRRNEIHREYLALAKVTGLTYDEVFRWCMLRSSSFDPDAVIEDLLRFVSADPDDRWSRLALAHNLRKMGRHAAAESTLLPLPRDDREANAIGVQIALDRQEYNRAEELLARGRSDNPAVARVRGRQALVRRDIGAAIENFRLAYAADPFDHESLFGLLTALEMRGDDKETKPIRELARLLGGLNTLCMRGYAPDASKDAALLREFGFACAGLHRDAEAREWFKLAISRNPLDAEAQQALFRLNTALGSEAHPAAGTPGPPSREHDKLAR